MHWAPPDVRCTSNSVYDGTGRRGRGGGGVEKSPAKSGSLFALHTDTLVFIGIDGVSALFHAKSVVCLWMTRQ